MPQDPEQHASSGPPWHFGFFLTSSIRPTMSRRLLPVPLLLSLALGCPPVATAAAVEHSAVRETAREIPVAKEVDVVVVGGSSGAEIGRASCRERVSSPV